MIKKSTLYGVVNRDYKILAKGSKAAMTKLIKKEGRDNLAMVVTMRPVGDTFPSFCHFRLKV
jgi:hypothetical protein